MTETTETMTTSQWRALADDGEFYATWFEAMADLQESIDLNQTDAVDGLTCTEQAFHLRQRLMMALHNLERVAAKLDAEAFGPTR